MSINGLDEPDQEAFATCSRIEERITSVRDAIAGISDGRAAIERTSGSSDITADCR